MSSELFIKKYPVSLNELLVTPIIFLDNNPRINAISAPCLNHLKDLCEFGGYSGGAIRTALSRIRKRGEVKEIKDKEGFIRFYITKEQKLISKIVKANQDESDSFSIVVFTFQSVEDRRRYMARDVLKKFGFRLFAQNVYIRRKILRDPFEEHIKELGLDDSMFLFDCSDPSTAYFKKKIISKFPLEDAIIEIEMLLNDLKNFISEDLDDIEYTRRVLYFGPLHYKYCFINELPLPNSFYPKEYRIHELKHFYENIPFKRWESIKKYFRDLDKF